MGQPCGWNRKEEETRLDQFGCTNATSVAVLTPFMPICLLSSLLHSLVDTQTPARQTTWCTGQANLAELVGWRCCLAAWAAGGFHQEMIFFSLFKLAFLTAFVIQPVASEVQGSIWNHWLFHLNFGSKQHGSFRADVIGASHFICRLWFLKAVSST